MRVEIGKRYEFPIQIPDNGKHNDGLLEQVVGDIAYVITRNGVVETWLLADDCDGEKYFYKADIKVHSESETLRKAYGYKWHPSIHMPKEAARIWLTVTDVKVERLQDMDDGDALNEGVHYDKYPEGFTWKQMTDMYNCYIDPIGAMMELWNSTINKKQLDQYGWNANPWVWVIKFERCEKPEEEFNEK